MISLPPPLGGGKLTLWRLDAAIHAATWNSGEGAFRAGGRWNSKGVRAVYAALDPATAILEVAVHKGLRILDTTAHVMSAAPLHEPCACHVVREADIPNPHWLRPSIPSAGQQAFGDALLKTHPFVLVPSVVSNHSWNIVFDPDAASSLYGAVMQERFALDPRLHPPLL